MPNVIEKNSISSELAQRMVDAALVKAKAIGVTENVAVVDDGGNLKAFARMDGAPILSIEISQHKAYTALFGLATQEFFKYIQADPSLLVGIPQLARLRLRPPRNARRVRLRLASGSVVLTRLRRGEPSRRPAQNLTHLHAFPVFKTSSEL